MSPLLEDALMDRDLVHRQTACSVVMHMSLGVAGLGCEDALTHLLNYVFPNIFETSPHIVQVGGALVGGCTSHRVRDLEVGAFWSGVGRCCLPHTAPVNWLAGPDLT